MCGITGIFSTDLQHATRARVLAMNTALAHRGPDDEGVYEAPHLVLGHRRLSIIDLSAAGHQPMTTADGRYTLVYNGELYNYRDIRAQLPDWQFRTATDTEVILAAYATWGIACLQRFNGMFAFALYDAQLQQVRLVRDRLGIKPLYVWQQGNTVAFASEIRALLASGLVPRRADRAAVGEYLRYQTVHAPHTVVQDVQLLLPGHLLTITANGVSDETWWQLPGDFRSEVATQSLTEQHSTIRRLLRDAVERRLVADVPFGAFLSGGIDSSAIVGLMHEVATAPVDTFSVTFDESEFSEAQYARLIAKRFNTRHHEICLRPSDFLNDLPAAVAAMDHPGGDGPNTWIVSKATKAAGISMALSGLGGDELFAGYAVFNRMAALEQRRWLNAVPQGVRRMGGSLLQRLKPGVAAAKTAEVLRLHRIGFETAYPLARLLLLPNQLDQVGGNAFGAYTTVADHTAPLAPLMDGKHLLSRVSVAEITTYMQHVLLRDSDQMSMAHGLELRVPFLDYTLVEYVLAISDQHKFPHTPKQLLVQALGDLLPPEIVNRPKMGFTLPWTDWMKNDLRSFCETRMHSLAAREPFSSAGVKQLWQQFLAGDPAVSWSRVWPLIVLDDWLSRNSVDL